jgi:hypothetical protein
MSDPVANPSLLSLQVGQSAEGSVAVSAPSAAAMTASITGGNGFLSIKTVTATTYVWRDANPNEQKQLPQVPGSGTRPRQVSQILVPEVVGASDGKTP